MPDPYAYWQHIVSQRSAKVNADAAGDTLLSVETQIGDERDDGILSYVAGNFSGFIRHLRFLPREDQELLLIYLVLGKKQTDLAIVCRSTQTLCASSIKLAVECLCAFLACPPTEDNLRELFVAAGIEQTELGVPLSVLVTQYARCRSFQRVAEIHGLRRESIKPVLRSAISPLAASTDRRARAISSYIYRLTHKASSYGIGGSSYERAKEGNVYITTPRILGQFRIDVQAKDFKQLFHSRAHHDRR